MPSDSFLQAMGPAMAAYGSPQMLQPSMIPGVQNVGMGGPVAPLPPPPVPPDGGMSVQPPAPIPASMPAPMSYAQPPPPVPAPPPPPEAPKTILTKGVGGLPAREVLTEGPTGLALNKQIYEAQREGLEGQVEAQKTGALQAGIHAQIRADEAQKKVDDAAALQAAQQKNLQDANEKVKAATDEGKNVAPITDYWADRSTFQRIGSAIAIGLAGFGQAISRSGGPNPAMQMLQADMDRDLQTKQLRFKAQTEAGSKKRDVAQQYYDNMVKQFGLQPANELMAAAQREKVAAEIDQQAAAQKLPELQANGVKMAADLRAQQLTHQENALKYIQAQKGEDMYVDPNIGIPMKRAEIAGYREKAVLQGNELDNRATVAAMKDKGQHSDENRRFISKEMQSAGIPSAKSMLETARKATQDAGDKGTGVIAAEMWKRSPVLFEKTYGPEATAREQAFQGLANLDIHNTSGGAVSADEWVRNSAKLYGAKDQESRARALAAFGHSLDKGETNIKAGGGADAAAEYDRNVQAMSPAPVQFTPGK